MSESVYLKKIFFWKTVEIFGKLYIENKLCHVVPPAKSVGYIDEEKQMTIIQTWHVAQGKYIFGKPVLVRNVHSPSVFIFTRINY